MKKIFAICLLPIVIIIACINQSKKTTKPNQAYVQDDSITLKCNYTINDLRSDFLDKELNKIVKNDSCYTVRDSILIGEDLEWNSKIFYKNNQISFMVENNWRDKRKISRIIILDENLKTSDGLGIGEKFINIRNFVSKKIPSMPDGYFAVIDANESKIFYHLDVEKYPDLSKGLINNIYEIPDSVEVSSITIQ
ncbi:hypothetical protein [Pedobacter glucosidilyticus]|uniref:hypothetical protein n=1 Tax=Pedobacter glucosidilyticus TaxID=1122941 RepID=UPI0003F553FC|nr:hypothetical protein [Pedobacter glucosidilyticus]